MKNKHWWLLSSLISLLLIATLIMLWVEMNNYHIAPTQLVNQQAVDSYLNTHPRNNANDTKISNADKVKTGIFIQSLRFMNSTEVNLTGYLWQKYQRGVQDAIKPKQGEVGFVLPEQVNSSFTPMEVYRHQIGEEEVIGWYFEVTLRQPFDYHDYPFDHKTVWVRLWHKDFASNVVLVPDLESYQSTGSNDIFGIEQGIVLGTWERENTFFDYKMSDYDTNFGLSSYTGLQEFPELHYNFVLKRKFENAFIVYLLPLFLVAALLFASLLTVSSHDVLSQKFGFSASAFIGACSALFFVVLLAHIQLREQFAGSGIVYLEYFYILMYAMLVLATVNTFLFSVYSTHENHWLVYRDNLIAKVLYWPLLLAAMVLISLNFI